MLGTTANFFSSVKDNRANVYNSEADLKVIQNFQVYLHKVAFFYKHCLQSASDRGSKIGTWELFD